MPSVRCWMNKWVIAISSLVIFLIGCNQSGRDGLALFLAADGSPIYPVSSGSEDGALLAIGFQAFLFTVVLSIFSMPAKSSGKTQEVAYWLNFGLILLLVALVEMDSSIIGAAMAGDIVPLIGVVVALLPALFIMGTYLVTRSRPTLSEPLSSNVIMQIRARLLLSFTAAGFALGGLCTVALWDLFHGARYIHMVTGAYPSWLLLAFPFTTAVLTGFTASFFNAESFGAPQGALVSALALVAFCIILNALHGGNLESFGPLLLAAFVFFGWALVPLGALLGWFLKRSARAAL